MMARLSYPFAFGWVEGGMVDHVQRVASGQRIYVTPSLEFVPFIYPPGFYYAAALLTPLLGGGFTPLRVVSIVSTIAVFALIFLLVWRETRDRGLGLIAAGSFAATYAVGGTWFDMGRVDMLFLALLFGAIYLMRPSADVRYALPAGLLLAAAVLTKQSGVVMAAPAVCWLLLMRRRAGLIVAGATVVALAAAVLLLDATNDGWFSYYMFQQPSNYRMQYQRMVPFVTNDLVGLVPFVLILAVFYTMQASLRSSSAFYVCMAAGMIAGAGLSRLNAGGFVNVVLPAFASLCVLAALGVHRLGPMLAGARGLASGWPYVLAVLHFGPIVYNPFNHLPEAADITAGRQFVERLRQVDGPVWVPFHSYLTTMAGKPPHAHWAGAADILTFGDPAIAAPFRAELQRAVDERRYGLIAIDDRPFGGLPSLEGAYELTGHAFKEPDVFWTAAGGGRRPDRIYEPRQSDVSGAGGPTTR